MASYSNIHASLLRYCSDTAIQQNVLTGLPFKAVDLDAYADDNELPQEQLIGIDNLAMSSSSDGNAFDTFSVLVTIGLRNDVNNMLLGKITDGMFEQLRPNQEVPLLDVDSGTRIGTMKLFGRTQVLPIVKSEAGIIFRSISIQGSAPIR